jgi:hypothetical protein
VVRAQAPWQCASIGTGAVMVPVVFWFHFGCWVHNAAARKGTATAVFIVKENIDFRKKLTESPK